jgi:hypothetical protein
MTVEHLHCSELKIKEATKFRKPTKDMDGSVKPTQAQLFTNSFAEEETPYNRAQFNNNRKLQTTVFSYY